MDAVVTPAEESIDPETRGRRQRMRNCMVFRCESFSAAAPKTKKHRTQG
jgi:hypothetical protein